MSKRTVVMSSILAAVLIATVMTGTVFAAGPRDPEGTSAGKRGYAAASQSRGFVDADGDGINDRGGDSGRFALSDGTRMLDGFGNGYAYGFVDEDGDGVNDRGGQSGRYAQGDGVPDLDGGNFVDADGDGLCDNCGDADCTPGTGANAARRGGRWSR